MNRNWRLLTKVKKKRDIYKSHDNFIKSKKILICSVTDRYFPKVFGLYTRKSWKAFGVNTWNERRCW